MIFDSLTPLNKSILGFAARALCLALPGFCQSAALNTNKGISRLIFRMCPIKQILIKREQKTHLHRGRLCFVGKDFTICHSFRFASHPPSSSLAAQSHTHTSLLPKWRKHGVAPKEAVYPAVTTLECFFKCACFHVCAVFIIFCIYFLKNPIFLMTSLSFLWKHSRQRAETQPTPASIRFLLIAAPI